MKDFRFNYTLLFDNLLSFHKTVTGRSGISVYLFNRSLVRGKRETKLTQSFDQECSYKETIGINL